MAKQITDRHGQKRTIINGFDVETRRPPKTGRPKTSFKVDFRVVFAVFGVSAEYRSRRGDTGGVVGRQKISSYWFLYGF